MKTRDEISEIIMNVITNPDKINLKSLEVILINSTLPVSNLDYQKIDPDVLIKLIDQSNSSIVINLVKKYQSTFLSEIKRILSNER